MHRQQRRQRHEEVVTGGERRGCGGVMAASRRGRFDYHDRHGNGYHATVPVVDQADCTAQSCRSCVALTLADAIALGCCPCAVFSLLGLAFVKAPLAVARRWLRRLRRRRGELRQKKRVRDMDSTAAKCRRRGAPGADAWKGEVGLEAADGPAAASRRASSSSSGRLDAEKVWMEMFRLGQWGFGRLSVSVNPPTVRAGGHMAGARSPDGEGGGRSRRKDADLRCET